MDKHNKETMKEKVEHTAHKMEAGMKHGMAEAKEKAHEMKNDIKHGAEKIKEKVAEKKQEMKDKKNHKKSA